MKMSVIGVPGRTGYPAKQPRSARRALQGGLPRCRSSLHRQADTVWRNRSVREPGTAFGRHLDAVILRPDFEVRGPGLEFLQHRCLREDLP